MVPAPSTIPVTSCCSGVNTQTCSDGSIIEAYCCDESTCQWQFLVSCPSSVPSPSPLSTSDSEPVPQPSSQSTIPEPIPTSEESPEWESPEPAPSSDMSEPCDNMEPGSLPATSEPAPSSEQSPATQPSSESMTPEPTPSSESMTPEPTPSSETSSDMSEPCDDNNMTPKPAPSKQSSAPQPSPVLTVPEPTPSSETSSDMSEPCDNMQPGSLPPTSGQSPVTQSPSQSTTEPIPSSDQSSVPQPSSASVPSAMDCSGRCTGSPTCRFAKCTMVSVTVPGAPSPASNCRSGTIIASGTVTESPSGITANGAVTLSKPINGLGSITETPAGITGIGSVTIDGPIDASGTVTETPSGFVASGTITAEESSPCNSTGSSNSTSVVVNQCQWVCPSFCSSWCSSYECPSGTSLVSCGPHPNDISACLPICASSECNDSFTSENISSECTSGHVETWKSIDGNCSKTCPSISCDDPCSPNCVPICALGGPRSPCINSRCSLKSGVEIIEGGASATPDILSSCTWTPSFNSYNCVSEVINTCKGNPMCASASCEFDGIGNYYWDNSVCNIDCTTLNQSQCLGGFLDCSGGPGICTLIGNSCTWICPINPCQNSSGYPLCPSPAPVGTPFDGCLSWNSRCIVSNVTAFPVACTWDVQCTAVNQSLTGPCNVTDCGAKPNTSCSGSEAWACVRPSGVGNCQWAFSCPPNLNLSTPCSDEECSTLNLVKTRNTTVCGINPTAKPVCVRNCKGICQNLTPCYPVYQPPTCKRSSCGDMCYDPRWLSGEQIAPDSFNASLVNVPASNCSICLRRCSAFLLCGRPSSNPICQFSHSDAYDKCVSRCTTLPVLSPILPANQTTQCTGRNPCNCNYSICTFVTVQYSSGNIYAECLSHDKANHASSLPGYQVLYSSVSLPTYCLLPQNSTNSTSVGNFINKVNNCSSDLFQQNLLDKLLNMTNSTSNYTDYIPQISAVLVPSVNTSTNWTSLSNSTLFNSSFPSNSSSNSSFVNVGVIVSLYGDKPPSNSTLAQWCHFILDNCIATTLNISQSQLTYCSLIPTGSSSSSLYSKRSVQNTEFSGTYLLTSTVILAQDSPISTVPAAPSNQTITITTPGAPTFNSPSSASGLACSVVLMAALVLSIVF